jgi:hypothetical protein
MLTVRVMVGVRWWVGWVVGRESGGRNRVWLFTGSKDGRGSVRLALIIQNLVAAKRVSASQTTEPRPHKLRKAWPFGVKWGNARIRGPHEVVLLHCVSHRIHPQVVI